MQRIIPIVEGDGDREAVPLLIRKILMAGEYWGWDVGRPKQARNLTLLQQKLDSFLGYALKEPDCGGILILLDLDDGCPAVMAQKLANQTQQLALPKPVTIALAHREYESWFLASAPALSGHYDLPPDLQVPAHVEQVRGAKEWLTRQMPKNTVYKETVHQAKLTTRLDLALASHHSRSFRRLVHAIEQLVTAADGGERGYVTPKGRGGSAKETTTEGE